MTPDHERTSIYDWAVTRNLQPEPITVEIWRNLPEEFCRQVELVNVSIDSEALLAAFVAGNNVVINCVGILREARR